MHWNFFLLNTISQLLFGFDCREIFIKRIGLCLTLFLSFYDDGWLWHLLHSRRYLTDEKSGSYHKAHVDLQNDPKTRWNFFFISVYISQPQTGWTSWLIFVIIYLPMEIAIYINRYVCRLRYGIAACSRIVIIFVIF